MPQYGCTALVLPLQYFIKAFGEIMNNKSSSPREVAVAVKGYGYFAAVSVHMI